MFESMTKIGIFSLGLFVGVMSTRTYFKTKYKTIADEEIASVKEVFNNSRTVPNQKTEEPNTKTSSVTYYADGEKTTIAYKDFYGGTEKDLSDVQTVFPIEEEPFEISQDDWDDDNDFVKLTLNYYTEDGVLIYEETEDIAEDEKTVGIQNLDDFCRVPDQSAYFRDPKLKIDYWVVKVYGSYHELIAGNV